MKTKKETFTFYHLALFCCLIFATIILCVCVGSVTIPVTQTLEVLWKGLTNQPISSDLPGSIILSVRFPRVLCAALIGAALALCGGAMQGLLRNPLADGSTLGVSAGASLGAVLAIALGITLPALPFMGTMGMAILFAFLSLVLILSLAYKLDHSLSTHTIILIGVIFSMFAQSIISFITVFSGEKVKQITFWTMGSLAQGSYQNALILLVTLLVFGTLLVRYARELNAFAIGEDHARHIGVNVKKVKFIVLFAASCLIGVCVSIGGSIGFVGLVIPHMVRMIMGPNHKRLLLASVFSGALFLMLADLVGRTILSPLELPIGVVTSFIGSLVFIYIFYTSGKKK